MLLFCCFQNYISARPPLICVWWCLKGQKMILFACLGSLHFQQISLNGPVPSSGLLVVESKLGWMVSDSTPVLLTQDKILAQEVERMLSLSSARKGLIVQKLAPEMSDHQVGSSYAREERSGAWANQTVLLLQCFPFLTMFGQVMVLSLGQ